MALTQGTWIVFGHYLTVQPWTVDFDALRPFPSTILAWIRFSGLQGFLYKKSVKGDRKLGGNSGKSRHKNK
ncbi:hypothetical protein ES332_D03G144000v1 [Gossypium tomentosum]|uniref:Uncharacterized protein n=1 Tax=Gossypium tomentosum TaxID=34277 RepID=A0A5D2LMM1_GOSTO|nr:hypothetical protein ES332_D03G144000v1 [Gossypium tomentosum]